MHARAARWICFIGMMNIATRSELISTHIEKSYRDIDCRRDGIGLSRKRMLTKLWTRQDKLRVVYLDGPYVTQNEAAISKAKFMNTSYEFGVTCESAETAIPEWSPVNSSAYLFRFIS